MTALVAFAAVPGGGSEFVCTAGEVGPMPVMYIATVSFGCTGLLALSINDPSERMIIPWREPSDIVVSKMPGPDERTVTLTVVVPPLTVTATGTLLPGVTSQGT